MADESFEDSMFSNGASGSGLDAYEGHNILLIPREWTKDGFTDPTGKKVDILDADIVSFETEVPEMEESVRIFAGRLVSGMKRGAIFNAQHEVDESTGLPKMTVGQLIKGPKSTGRTQPWLLEPITDRSVLGRMAAYARANLKPKDPFSPVD